VTGDFFVLAGYLNITVVYGADRGQNCYRLAPCKNKFTEELPMSDDTEMYASTVEADNAEMLSEPIVPEEPAPTLEPASTNDVVLASALSSYQQLVEQLEANRQSIHTSRQELAQLRQQIRDLSALSKRDSHLEDDADSHGLHTSKVAVQYDDCGSIIAYAEQVRRNVYDNIAEAEELLSPMSQSVELLKLRVRHIRLLENLLAAQETGLRLEIQQRNADACIWQLADILKV
jgi:hypothetical protein